MATDYDAPRAAVVDLEEDSLEQLKGRHSDAQSPVVDVDDPETFDLPGGDLTDEELMVKVVPIQSDEFRCAKCFLVHHRTQLATMRGDDHICRECA